MESRTITINLAPILVGMYAIAKVAVAIWICRHEFQYPIWDKNGHQIPRRIHHILRAFIWHCVTGIEWSSIKILAFAVVAIFTGKRFLQYFLPWRIKSPPPFCDICKDKGKYYVPSSLKGAKGNWVECTACKDAPNPDRVFVNCRVCLDQKHIGPNRPCPHCERIASRNSFRCCRCGRPTQVSPGRKCWECCNVLESPIPQRMSDEEWERRCQAYEENGF